MIAVVAAPAVLLAAGAVPGAERGGAPPVLARPDRRLVLVGTVAFCGFLVEGAATSWAAVHLRTEHGASPGVAAAGYPGTVLALAAVRLAGDRVVARIGRVRAVQASGLVAAAGAALVVLAPTAAAALAGWAVLGAGIALVAPTVLAAAPTVSRNPAPTAIAAVAILGYAGSFTGPPVIGAVAAGTTLSRALGLAVAAALTVAALARRSLR